LVHAKDFLTGVAAWSPARARGGEAGCPAAGVAGGGGKDFWKTPRKRLDRLAGPCGAL